MSLSASERLLLDALLLSLPQAEDAWRSWRASTDLNRLDNGSFHLIPALAGRMPAWLDGDPQRAILLGICRRAWSQNQIQRKLLADAVAALAAAGIQRVAATGPIAWGAEYWPEGAIRPIGIVDLLIEPGVVLRALDALSRCGWKAVSEIPDTGRKGFPFSGGFRMQAASGDLRLHWRALPNTDFGLRPPGMPSLQAGKTNLAADFTMPPEESLVAALGGAHDDGVDWRYDAIMMCRRPDLSWKRIGDLLRWRSKPRERLDELRREYDAGIPAEVTKPASTSGVESVLSSTLRAYRRLRGPR